MSAPVPTPVFVLFSPTATIASKSLGSNAWRKGIDKAAPVRPRAIAASLAKFKFATPTYARQRHSASRRGISPSIDSHHRDLLDAVAQVGVVGVGGVVAGAAEELVRLAV